MEGDTVSTATFLMTDIEGSTRLWETIPERMPDLLAHHDGIVAAAVVGCGGSLVKLRGEGDSHFAVFARSADALAAAVALQRRLAQEPSLAAVPIRVRVGVHAGDATFRGMDYYGPSVNRCARLRGIGAGGQVLVSEAATSLAQDGLPEGVGLRDLGVHRLRDLLRPERVYQLVADGLRDDFPELRSLNGSSIPQQVTAFVGRERALAEIGRRLGGARLLTLLGTGGIGKTRLAYQVAAEAAARFDDGAAVVELAEIPEEGGVEAAVAAALGAKGDPLEALRDRGALLVLDNCEHVLEGVRRLARRVLRECPRTTILATSRQTLRVAGEETYGVAPLSLPAPAPGSLEELMLSEAGRLFVERAEAVAPRFEAHAGNLEAIARVCARLDGLPLAIELAAARSNVLSPGQIDDRLAHRFQLLGGRRGSDEGRHRTMRETIDWSFRMLDAAERALMGRVSAFRGGWTFEAIETALDERWSLDDDPLDVLQSVVERSLVFVEDLSGEAARYRLLETIRDYVLEATPPEEAEKANEGLFAWAESFAALAADRLERADQHVWFDRTDAERENLRAAVVYGAARPELRVRALRLVASLHRFWVARGHYALGRSLLAPALEAAPDAPAPLRAQATNLLGALAMCQGDLEAADVWLTRGLALAREIGDASAEGSTLCNLGMIAWERRDGEPARRHYEEAVAVLRAANDGGRLGSALLNLGSVLTDLGKPDEAAASLRAALAPLRERGDLSRIALTVGNLGHLAILREDWDEARRAIREALAALGGVGDTTSAVNTLVSAAAILRHDGDLEGVAAIRGGIESLGTLTQAAPTPRSVPILEDLDAALAEGLDEPRRRALERRGARMAPAAVIDHALARLDGSRAG